MDCVLYWNANDLQSNLDEFKIYINESRVPLGSKGKTPNQQGTLTEVKIADFHKYSWASHCSGLFEMPIAAGLAIRHCRHG